MARKFYIKPNETYGLYTTIEEVKYTTPSGIIEKRWKCKDQYGNISYKRARALDARSQSDLMCDETNKFLVSQNAHQLGLRKSIYLEYKNNAESRHHDFNLTFEEFNKLISGNCEYCGSNPEIRNGGHLEKRKNKDQPDLYTNGVDRIDSSKGYTIDNCVSCCSKCNMMKNIYTKDEFLNHITKIFNYQINKSSSTISQESTSQVNGDGNGEPLIKGEDIV